MSTTLHYAAHVAVYTHLDETALRALWSVYDDEHELVRAVGIPHGSINTTYRLETEAGAFFLRINENKATDDVFFERDLLDKLALAHLGAVTPTIKKNRVGGSFYLVEERAHRPVWAAVFPELPGRDLGVFEVEPAHTAQVGAFLARAHQALRGAGSRPNPYGLPVVVRAHHHAGTTRHRARREARPPRATLALGRVRSAHQPLRVGRRLWNA